MVRRGFWAMAGARRRELKKLKRQIYKTRIQQMQGQHVHTTFDDLQKKGASTPTGFFGISSLDTALPNGEITAGAIHEFFPASYNDFPAALGFMLCILQRLIHQNTMQPPSILWCHKLDRTEFPTLPYPPGLSFYTPPTLRLLTVSSRREEDMLWTLEEGLSTNCNSLVIGVNAGTEKIYDFTASRRLSLRAKRTGNRLLLLRPHSAKAELGRSTTTTAVTRWEIAAQTSQPVKYINARTPVPGNPRWQVALTRSKGGKTGNWILEWDYETFSFHLASLLADRKSPARPQPRNYPTNTPTTERLYRTGN